jgi:hypothetical protein
MKSLKTLLKRFLFTSVLVFLLAVVGFYLYIQSLPTAPPDFVDSREVNLQQARQIFHCSAGQDFEYAYAVKVKIDSELNQKPIYQSQLNFKTQFAQINGRIVQGLAQNIHIQENDQAWVNDLPQVYFLARASSNPHIVFTAFNDLGLADKHPMKILGQFFKGLSVGQENENYHFAYDSMQRTYHYQHHGKRISRLSRTTTANMQHLTNSLQHTPQNMLWQVELDDDCLPRTLVSEEYQDISAAGHSGFIRFHIQAHKVPLFTQLNSLDLNNYSNSQNHWQSQAIRSESFEQEVQSLEEMWQIFNGFSNSTVSQGLNKNTAKLIKAADFLVSQVSPEELADYLLDPQIDGATQRDISFALSLSQHQDAESYIVDTLQAINNSSPSQGTSNNHSELQQVRLMVALSSTNQITAHGFQALAELANDSEQNTNIRSNALINQASSLQQMKNQGQDPGYLEQQLIEDLSHAIQGDQASAAILAAGNSQLIELEPLIISKLESSDEKERYAAVTVLAKNSANNQRLIEHFKIENSNLVSYSLLTNLDTLSLSDDEKNELRLLSQSADKDIRELITQLIQ